MVKNTRSVALYSPQTIVVSNNGVSGKINDKGQVGLNIPALHRGTDGGCLSEYEHDTVGFIGDWSIFIPSLSLVFMGDFRSKCVRIGTGR